MDVFVGFMHPGCDSTGRAGSILKYAYLNILTFQWVQPLCANLDLFAAFVI